MMFEIRGTYMTEQGFQDGDGILLVEQRADGLYEADDVLHDNKLYVEPLSDGQVEIRGTQSAIRFMPAAGEWERVGLAQ